TPSSAVPSKLKTKEYDDSLFEHAGWIYAFCREHLFRDDTKRMITALWPNGGPAPGTRLVELGCGPGFYACELAERFQYILITGGRCFVAEPRFAFWASIPLFAMWLLARVTHSRNGYREPQHAAVFSTSAFETLFAGQPWKRRTIWKDGRYQYALCEKP